MHVAIFPYYEAMGLPPSHSYNDAIKMLMYSELRQCKLKP